jgi:hypothetical protein
VIDRSGGDHGRLSEISVQVRSLFNRSDLEA